MILGKKPKKINGNRMACQLVAPEAIIATLSTGVRQVIKNHWPADAQIVQVQWSPAHHVFEILLISNDFKPLKPSERVPVLPPIEIKTWTGKDGGIE